MKRNKNIVAFLAMSFIVGVLPINFAYAKGKDAIININGVQQSLDQMNLNDTILVDAQKISEILDLEYRFESDGDWGFITTKDKKVLKFQKNNREAYYDNGTIELKVPPQIKDGKLMVPVRLITKCFNYSVQWLESSQTMMITSSKKVQYSDYSYYNEIKKDTSVLSYDEGFKKANDNNNNIGNLEDSKKLLYENRDDAVKAYKDAEFANAEEKDLVLGKRNIEIIENQIKDIEDNVELVGDNTEMLYLSYLTNIISNYTDLKLAEADLEIERVELKNTQLKHSLGFEVESTVKISEEKIQRSQDNIQYLKSSLEKDKEFLNDLLGYPVKEDIVVKFDPKYKAVDTSVDRYIAIKLNDDPLITLKQRRLKEAEYIKDTTIKELEESTIKLDNDIQKARRELQDAKSSLDKALRTSYNNLKGLEEQIKASEVDKNVKKVAYDNAVMLYETGSATEFEVTKAMEAMKKVEATIVKNKYTHFSARFGFENPQVLSR